MALLKRKVALRRDSGFVWAELPVAAAAFLSRNSTGNGDCCLGKDGLLLKAEKIINCAKKHTARMQSRCEIKRNKCSGWIPKKKWNENEPRSGSITSIIYHKSHYIA